MGRVYQTKRTVLTALFAAIIFVFTAYIFHVPIGTSGAYLHFGDTFIFITASVLPFPYALFAGGIGAGLADFVSDAPMWVPFTLVIKPLMALCFTSRGTKILGSKRNIVAPFIAGGICFVGYYLAEAILFGNFLSPLASVPGGIIQFCGSIVFYFVIAKVIDSRDLKGKIL